MRVHSPNAETLARALGVTVAEVDLGSSDGAFDAVSRRILLNPRVRSPERRRFTLCHEAIHALISTDPELLSELHDAAEGDDLERLLERICNAGAAELIMPEDEVRAALDVVGLRAQVIPRLARHAQASRQAACLQVARHLPGRSLALIARRAGDSAVVEFSSRAPGMRYTVTPGTVLAAGHPAAEAAVTGLPVRAQGALPFRSGKRLSAVVDAFPDRSVIYVLFLDPDLVPS